MGRKMKHPHGGYKTRHDLLKGLARARKTKTGYIPFEQWPRVLREENEDLVIENLKILANHNMLFCVNWAHVDYSVQNQFEKTREYKNYIRSFHIDWKGFAKRKFDKALKDGPHYEDSIYGIVDAHLGNKEYLIDIHFEGTPDFEDGDLEEECKFDFEIYRLHESGRGHGVWLGSTKSEELVSKSYEEFCSMAEDLIYDFLQPLEEEIRRAS